MVMLSFNIEGILCLFGIREWYRDQNCLRERMSEARFSKNLHLDFRKPETDLLRSNRNLFR